MIEKNMITKSGALVIGECTVCGTLSLLDRCWANSELVDFDCDACIDKVYWNKDMEELCPYPEEQIIWTDNMQLVGLTLSRPTAHKISLYKKQ